MFSIHCSLDDYVTFFLKVQVPCGTLTERATCLCERGQSELVAHSDNLAKNVQIQVQDRR